MVQLTEKRATLKFVLWLDKDMLFVIELKLNFDMFRMDRDTKL